MALCTRGIHGWRSEKMKTSDTVLWVVWLALIGLMLFTHDKQRMEIQRLNGVVYELRMERVDWVSRELGLEDWGIVSKEEAK